MSNEEYKFSMLLRTRPERNNLKGTYHGATGKALPTEVNWVK